MTGLNTGTYPGLAFHRSLSVRALAGCLFLLGSHVSAQDLAPLGNAIDLAVGQSHACVLTSFGGVKCWGLNDEGQLGDGTTENSVIPRNVVGLTSGVVAIEAGRRHTCAVTESGGAKCWGRNLLGQLGDGTDRRRLTPVDVMGLETDVDSISAGSGHTCAIKTDRELFCWGFNGDGQLGVGGQENRLTPNRVFGGQGVASVSAGIANTCALFLTGAVSCWGVVDRQCNIGCLFTGNTLPTRVNGIDGEVAQISAGEYFNCVVTTAGTVQCWGDNFDNQLGNLGTTDPDPLEIFDIEGLDADVVSVTSGFDHVCAQLTNGTARCWGDNTGGRLGDGTFEDRYPPVAVSNLDNIAEIIAGDGHTCARQTNGSVLCWGSNSSGQLGDNNPVFRLTATAVPGLSNIVDIAVGDFHGCALAGNGDVKCWGSNGAGQVGDGGNEPAREPVDVTGLPGPMMALTASANHSCAVDGNGNAYCWGNNDNRELGVGDNTDRNAPTPVLPLPAPAVDIDAGNFHTCANLANGRASCWGLNLDGQLGNANLRLSDDPVTVVNIFTGITAVSAGGTHSCALVGSSIECWGENDSGQVGDGTFNDALIPTMVNLPQPATAVSAGPEQTCAVSGGSIACWGSGVGPDPIFFGLTSGTTAISVGEDYRCAVISGQAQCWGANSFGQLGTGDTDFRLSPTPVEGLNSDVVQIEASTFHTCARTSAGTVSCWGSNQSNQLGLGGRDNRLPGPVLDDPSLFRSGFEAGEIQAKSAQKIDKPEIDVSNSRAFIPFTELPLALSRGLQTATL